MKIPGFLRNMGLFGPQNPLKPLDDALGIIAKYPRQVLDGIIEDHLDATEGVTEVTLQIGQKTWDVLRGSDSSSPSEEAQGRDVLSQYSAVADLANWDRAQQVFALFHMRLRLEFESIDVEQTVIHICVSSDNEMSLRRNLDRFVKDIHTPG